MSAKSIEFIISFLSILAFNFETRFKCSDSRVRNGIHFTDCIKNVISFLPTNAFRFEFVQNIYIYFSPNLISNPKNVINIWVLFVAVLSIYENFGPFLRKFHFESEFQIRVYQKLAIHWNSLDSCRRIFQWTIESKAKNDCNKEANARHFSV